MPLDTALHADQIAKLLKDSGTVLLFCDRKHLPLAAEAVGGLPIRLVLTDAEGERAAAVGHGGEAGKPAKIAATS